MSFRSFADSLNSPPLVAAAGVVVMTGHPFVQLGSASLAALQVANTTGFVVNTAAVSVPGRMDSPQDSRMRKGELDEVDPDGQTIDNNIVKASRERTLLAPSPWAFAIWAPIYAGEALFCAAQHFDASIMGALPHVTAPFVAANITQSLWCASFRPSYMKKGWHKYVSCLMLGGTAVSLSQIPFGGLTGSPYMIPLVMHYGWTTAATLVNLNGSIALNADVKDKTLVYAGHASAVLATCLGVGITVAQSIPTYGLTVAWALAACATGTTRVLDKRDNLHGTTSTASEELVQGAKFQKKLLWLGSALSAGASAYTLLL